MEPGVEQSSGAKPHYCDLAPGHPVHGPYHDTEYGFAVTDDRVLFERLTLEIFQAGLSWLIVLQKRAAFYGAFEEYSIEAVAAFDQADVTRLMLDRGIIRNRRKILATIENAQRLLIIQKNFGSFADWLSHHKTGGITEAPEWLRLFKKTFVFMGPEVVGEFLMSIGYLPGAHRPDCPVFKTLQSTASR
jgi:DNA-3-methyladenine glycosylase I